MIVIDGDHTLEGVSADSERALGYLRRNGGLLIWHDYYEGGPQWLGVKRYVDTLDLDIDIVNDTWFAMACIGVEARLPSHIAG
jgi:hypothetical protein